MAWAVPDRWDPSRSHDAAYAVEIWSDSTYIATVDGRQWLKGSVTERWVTGVRSTMQLTVPPTRAWRKWLDLPALELLPFSGMRWGRSEHLIPLGVFPVLAPDLSAPERPISLACRDHWQYVESGSFLRPRPAPAGQLIALAAAGLVQELGIGAGRRHPVTRDLVRYPAVTISSPEKVPAVVWEPDRKKVVQDMLEAIAAEGFIDRYGRPIFRDRKSQPGRPIRSGPGGTIKSVTRAVEWSDVVNSVIVYTTQNGITFDPIPAVITDPTHPASVTKIGPRSLIVRSPLVWNEEQSRAAARSLLEQRSAPQFTWQGSCIPDASLMPGDLSPVTTRQFGTVNVAALEITHPLDDADQTVRWGAVL